jgi:hypothetical protein
VASPVFKTGVTRPRRVGWVRFPHSPATIACALLALLIPAGLRAQIQPPQERPGKLERVTECLPIPVDTTTVIGVPSVIVGPVAPRTGPPPCKVPISPGSAFFRSLLVPGLGQMKLDRRKAATIFIVSEVGTVAMSLKSWNDLRKAKKAREDTVVTPVLDDEGEPVLDSLGVPKVTIEPRNPNLVGRIRARRTHLEDWMAGVLFNHLFSGLDAYVSAHLADFNTNVQANYVNGEVRVMARVSW